MATDIFGRGIDVERVNIVVNYDAPGDADSYLHRVGCVELCLGFISELTLRSCRRAGRFGTKGLSITFISSEADQEVLESIQSRFEVKVTELPEHIDPSTYSMCIFLLHQSFADVSPRIFFTVTS